LKVLLRANPAVRRFLGFSFGFEKVFEIVHIGTTRQLRGTPRSFCEKN
jgi:hypothetical protein